MEKIMAQLKKYEGKLRRVKIKRPYPSNSTIYGFIHEVNGEVALIQQFYDFFNDGYILLNVPEINSVKSNKCSEFFGKIMQKEGLMEQVQYDCSVPIKNMKEALSYFMKTGEIIIVEFGIPNEKKELFEIGKVTKIGKKNGHDALWFKSFDATGKWYKKKTITYIELVSNIQFRSPYVKYFSKHVKKEKK